MWLQQHRELRQYVVFYVQKVFSTIIPNAFVVRPFEKDDWLDPSFCHLFWQRWQMGSNCKIARFDTVEDMAKLFHGVIMNSACYLARRKLRGKDINTTTMSIGLTKWLMLWMTRLWGFINFHTIRYLWLSSIFMLLLLLSDKTVLYSPLYISAIVFNGTFDDFCRQILIICITIILPGNSEATCRNK